MSSRLVPKSVTLNVRERRNGLIFSLFHQFRVRYVVVKQLDQLGLPRFQNLLLIVYDRINTICAIIQRLFFLAKQTLITWFDGRRCIDD